MNGDIVFLAHRVPFPPDRGDKIRSWNILKALAKIAPVHVVAVIDPEEQDVDASELRAITKSLHLFPRDHSKMGAMATALLSGQSASVEAFSSKPLHAKMASLLNRQSIGAIYAFSGQMAQFVPKRHSGRFIMDFVDVDSAKFESFAEKGKGLKAMANAFEAKRLLAFEKAIAARADVSLFVSDAEAALFRSKTGFGSSRVRALGNGIDLDHYRPDHKRYIEMAGEGALLVFTGQMDYLPNVEAVDWFARQVLPKLPKMRFAIVGRAPTEAVKALGALPGVIVIGAVDDTRDWIAAADLVVAPLQLARGIQNKILEAMAMGKAVVASPAAAEGIEAEWGTEMAVANSPDSMASSIKALLASPNDRASMGAAARNRMVASYSWSARLADLPELLSGSSPR